MTGGTDGGATGGRSDLQADYLEMIAALGHELRRPLTVIRGAATLMIDMDGRLAPDKAVEMLNLIDGNVEDMSDLIEDLLVMAHLEAGDLHLYNEPVDAASLVAEATEAERRRTGDHPVRVLGAPPELIVNADRDRSVRALRALVQNAARHAPADSPIEVIVTEDGAASDRVRFEVRDSGPGIPAAEHEHVFDRFTKLTPGAGLGLGLYLVRGLARSMGGDAGVGDAPDGASAVWFTLRRRG